MIISKCFSFLEIIILHIKSHLSYSFVTVVLYCYNLFVTRGNFTPLRHVRRLPLSLDFLPQCTGYANGQQQNCRKRNWNLQSLIHQSGWRHSLVETHSQIYHHPIVYHKTLAHSHTYFRSKLCRKNTR